MKKQRRVDPERLRECKDNGERAKALIVVFDGHDILTYFGACR